MIYVANGKVDGWIGEYVGRPMKSGPSAVQKGSALQNPYKVTIHTQEEHEKVCRVYRTRLWDLVKGSLSQAVAVRQELQRLKRLALQGDLILTCWCRALDGSGLPCHAEVIKACLEWAIRTGYDFWVD